MISKPSQRFFLISNTKSLVSDFQTLWPREEVEWTFFERGGGAVEHIFNQPPDLLVVDYDLTDLPALEMIRLVKGENVYRQLPVVLCLPESALAGLNFFQVEVDDFLLKPFSADYARSRLRLAVYRSLRELDANPLTKLPGNTSIIHRIQDLIDQQEEFALAYVDLDHFKSYNDRYGFSRGDEVLMMTARIIVNTIRGFVGANGFIGHVGGDDYVFILPPAKVEEACQRIIDNFDSIVPNFYDTEDRKLGKICSVDRQGRACEYPLMAISIGVVVNTGGRIKHYGEVAQLAMNLKKKAKETPKSVYVMDQRQSD